MGLCIFIHKVSKSVANKYNLSFDSTSSEITDALTKEQAIEFNNKTNEMLGQLESNTRPKVNLNTRTLIWHSLRVWEKTYLYTSCMILN